MKEMKKKGRPLGEHEMEAKMKVIKAMRDMAAGHMGEKLKGLKKVTVASNDKEGLEAGLEKAKAMIGSGSDKERDDDMEDLEEDFGADLDHDDEEGEPLAHKMDVPHKESTECDPSELSEDELDAKLAELMALKNQMDAKKNRY